MHVNLISDTVTKPSPEMLAYMMEASVGDDVFKQDPTVNNLEEIVADLFGMEAALFMPSGTMANQVAIKLLTNPGEQVICDKYAHIYNYEGGGTAVHSGVTSCLLDGNRGMITLKQIQQEIIPQKQFYSPFTSLVAVENTTNKGGGACYELETLTEISDFCKATGLNFHLDGARIWNALIAKKQKPSDFGNLFDTISVCFSKGLGAPVGSLLLGSRAKIDQAIRVRKLLGGGMRQVGYLAAACLYALEYNVSRLAEDHVKAKELEAILQKCSWVTQVEPVETNIVIFSIIKELDEQQFVQFLADNHIEISAMGGGKLRMVTHLDYINDMHNYVKNILLGLEFDKN